MNSIRPPFLPWLLVPYVMLSLAGCASHQRLKEVHLPALPAAFSATGEAEVPPRWWQAVGDPTLAELINRGLNDNFSLRSAWARLRQARMIAQREGSALLPGVDAQVSTSRQRPPAGDWSSRRDASLSAAYEVDLWGRLRASTNAAELDAVASAADLQGAAITVSASIAESWYLVIEQRAQAALLEQQIAINQQLLNLIELRFRSGLAAASDVHRQRQLLEQTAGEISLALSRLSVSTNQLAVLIGRTPDRADLPETKQLPELPPLPKTGLPTELVRHRPDLRSAFWRLEAADARAAAAVAAQYPRLNLSAAINSSSTSGNLYSDWLSNLAAQLVGPIFDGGRRRADASRAAAVLEERLNDYRQTLLEALTEVENALDREAGQRRYLNHLRAQLREAEQVVRRERLRYLQGDSDYLSVLDAMRGQQRLERQIITAHRELIVERISLLRALAGGWEMAEPDGTPAEALRLQKTNGKTAG